MSPPCLHFTFTALATRTISGGGREVNPLLLAKFRSRYHPDDVLEATKGTMKATTNVVQWCKNWEKEG